MSWVGLEILYPTNQRSARDQKAQETACPEGAPRWSATQYFSISYQVLQNLVALLSLMKWNNIELECSKLQRWLA